MRKVAIEIILTLTVMEIKFMIGLMVETYVKTGWEKHLGVYILMLEVLLV